MYFNLAFAALIWLCLMLHVLTDSVPCSVRDFGNGGIVCVCNSSYCDTVEPNGRLSPGNIAQYVTSANQTLNQTFVHFNNKAKANIVFSVNRNIVYQTITGFGGAFTDAAGINILSLTGNARKYLLKSYYSPDGIEYTVGRIPMASCDFSTHPYSYDDTPMDFNLTHFSLAPEDLKYKIPIIQRAKALSQRSISIFGSPWSAPAWMKTNKNMTGKGRLIGEPGGKYYKTWANYFVRFLQEYGKHNITLWGLTAQNEPTDGELDNFPFQCMGWTPELQRDFIAMDLGPALHSSGYADVSLMMLDDQRILLSEWTDTVFSNPDNQKYVSGIGVHWYWDFLTPAVILDKTHAAFPSKFILATEACQGSQPWQLKKVILGSWDRAESYAHSIIEDINHWVTGWTDWNIALDMRGGPNWVNNFVDSPVIVNAKAGEFYKQPMFYAMGHFSKYVVPGSKRIELKLTGDNKNLHSVAFLLPDDSIVVTVLNKDPGSIPVTVEDKNLGSFTTVLDGRSITTWIWWFK
ncbi:LOW QUALITY PROTEIN: lysosomal acid glucosylceramidase-like [Gigantopelta aegis]|uniref:LOW QUALITY PROTEIN: lysosomal acid glucosylceramidase-like n=1 Tax=Gigantopelta aegis TaxID=1735272 RepID=UPI001B888CC5|nr:LOW QUALITY PROTEIN: lysosomal acid glucosylceramidase-like [Gigantopelta aegis]